MSNQYEQPYPGPHGPGDGYPEPPSPSETTQQWQGNTWDSQMQPRLGASPAHGPQAARAAYPPPAQPGAAVPYPHSSGPMPVAEAPGTHGGHARYDGTHAAAARYDDAQHTAGQYDGAHAAAARYDGAQRTAGQYDGARTGPHAHAAGQATGRAAAQAPQAAAHATPADPRAGHGAAAEPAGGAPAGDDRGGPDLAGYGPATVGGNARVTDAQRARAEGRSPIIDPGIQPAALTAALSLLLAGGAALGSWALLLPLVVLQGLTAAGWFRLNGMWPARQGIALGFLGALAADAAVLVVGREHGTGAVLGTLGVWVLLTLVLQLRSHAEPDERMYGLTAALAAAALAILATGHLAAAPEAVTTGGVAVAAAILVRAVVAKPPVAGMVLAVAVAAGAGLLLGDGTEGALLGAVAGLCAVVGHRVAAYDYPSRFVHFTAGVALPLALAAPAALLLG
ncbi:hypothetical protein [Streptomyces fragilis]|uniref:hypothetical protein n=1 Tax=Streptomyces fragilis TaxID=67301 RepID=UPI000D59D0E0|nr:hypothetical protein [Streptomyces fragilis]